MAHRERCWSGSIKSSQQRLSASRAFRLGMPSVNPVLPASSENARCRRPEERGGGSDEERGQGLAGPAGGLLSRASARRPRAEALPGRSAPRCGNRSEGSETVHTEARTPGALPCPSPSWAREGGPISRPHCPDRGGHPPGQVPRLAHLRPPSRAPA